MLSGAGHAEQEIEPDMAFLEYLGMWDETDEEWQLLAEEDVIDDETRNDPVPQGEESVENVDES